MSNRLEAALEAKKLANLAEDAAVIARRQLEAAQRRARELLSLPIYPF